MKIVAVDNYDREMKNDILVCENVNQRYGNFLTNQLNDKFSGANGDKFFQLVEDNYKLYKFEP